MAPHNDNESLNRLCLCPGVDLLLQAAICAQDCGRKLWEFAVEIDALLEAGLTVTDLRWLIAKGYAEHADETTRISHSVRHFRRIKPLIFTPRTCLALTDAGVAKIMQTISSRHKAEDDPHESCAAIDTTRADAIGVAAIALVPGTTGDKPRRIEKSDRGEPAIGTSPHIEPASKGSRAAFQKPFWNPALHELRFGHRAVKRFRRPAKSQELILTVFQEEGWPPVIDDPLPVDPSQNASQRLHHTVYHMNRAQRPHLVHFYVNGNGQSIYWQPARDRCAKSARRARKRR